MTMSTRTRTAMETTTRMTIDAAKLMRLQSWLSPAFPTGAYSYSHGLERAVEAGMVSDRGTLVDWLDADLRFGSGRADGIFFAETWRAVKVEVPRAQQPPLPWGEGEGEGVRTLDRHYPLTLSLSPWERGPDATECPPRGAVPQGKEFGAVAEGVECSDWQNVNQRHPLRTIAEFAAAMRATSELALEATQQGIAFLTAIRRAWPHPRLDRLAADLQDAGIPPMLPIATGMACAVHNIALDLALPLYLHAGAANLINAAVRLIPLGQTDGQMAVAALETAISETAKEAMNASLSEIGSAAFMIDIASMQHETQYTRLFRS